MKIAIGCDHIVTKIKDDIVSYLRNKGFDVVDVGTYDTNRTHYPIYGRKVGLEVVLNNADFGVVICGTGVGITNAVNKVPGIRAVLVRDVATAINAREELNANVVGFGGRITGLGLIQEIINSFISTKHKSNENNLKLISKINKLLTDEEYIKNENIFDPLLDKWNKGYYKD